MGHHARAPAVWAAHAEGLAVRAIAERLKMGKSTVQRILDAGREHLQEVQRQKAGQVLDIAAWLLEQGLADHADSLRVAGLIEHGPEGGAEDHVPDLGGLWFERNSRTKIRQAIAALTGQDPIRREGLELKRRQLAGNKSLRDTLEKALGLAETEEPEADA